MKREVQSLQGAYIYGKSAVLMVRRQKVCGNRLMPFLLAEATGLGIERW